MKAIEIYLDESGEIQPDSTRKKMNISGLVLKGAKDRLGLFHEQVYNHLATSAKTVGLCDQKGKDPNLPGRSKGYLRKRPREDATPDEWNAHTLAVCDAAAEIQGIAKKCGVEIAACSLVFPASSTSPFKTVLPEVAVLLDRFYLKRMEDILELILFETPFVTSALEAASHLSVNFATRVATLSIASPKRQQELFSDIPSEFGFMNVWSGREDEHKFFCDTIQASSAGGILSGAMNRRPNDWRKLSESMQIQRCVCCKLADWDSRAFRSFDSSYDVMPRHVHYFADYLCNFVLRRELNQFVGLAPFKSWLEKGFLLNAKDQPIDHWLDSMRMFANGDKVEALANLRLNQALTLPGRESSIIKDRTKQWKDRLSGDDMRALFKRFHPSSAIPCDVDKSVVDVQTVPAQRWIGPVPLNLRMDDLMKSLANRFPQWIASRVWASVTSRSGDTVYWVPMTCSGISLELPEEVDLLGRTFIVIAKNPES